MDFVKQEGTVPGLTIIGIIDIIAEKLIVVEEHSKNIFLLFHFV